MREPWLVQARELRSKEPVPQGTGLFDRCLDPKTTNMLQTVEGQPNSRPALDGAAVFRCVRRDHLPPRQPLVPRWFSRRRHLLHPVGLSDRIMAAHRARPHRDQRSARFLSSSSEAAPRDFAVARSVAMPCWPTRRHSSGSSRGSPLVAHVCHELATDLVRAVKLPNSSQGVAGAALLVGSNQGAVLPRVAGRMRRTCPDNRASATLHDERRMADAERRRRRHGRNTAKGHEAQNERGVPQGLGSTAWS